MDRNNPPAFPVIVERNTSTDPLATPRQFQMEGLTLRDYFAAKALAPVVALLGRDVGCADMLAKDAYTIADAMLLARTKGGAA